MITLFGKKKPTMTIEKDFEKKQKELAYAIKLSIGKRTITEFVALCKLNDPEPILSIRKMEYKEFPDRQLLRRIASNSDGRITWQHLYDLCGYSERDPEEDRSWAKWVPQWGSVYMCDLGTREDNIQGGKRPIVVIQNNKGNQHSPNVSILPISTKNKFSNSSLHIFLEKEIGFLRDSWVYAEMPMTISKRRFFYNTIPYKITTLPENKMNEIKYALGKQLGFEPLVFDEVEAFKIVQNIRALQENIKVKKSNNLHGLLEEKLKELKEYCAKYNKDHNYMLKEYDRVYSFGYQAI